MANIKEQVVVYKDELYVKGVGGVRDLQDLKDKKSLQDVLKGWDGKGGEDSDSSGEGTCPQSHPDISTQPSLLPQKFGNYDMYERLIPVSDLDPYDAGYVAEGEEKGMVVTSCFLISDLLSVPGAAHITRDYYYDGDTPIGDLVAFRDCNSSYNIMEFQYILIQYYVPTNPAYYYDDESSESSGEQPEDVDEIGNVTKNASNLSISIDDGALPEGTYSMVYEDSTGTPLEGVDEITNFTIN